MGSRPYHRSAAAQEEELARLKQGTAQAISEIQAWCPTCSGGGMVVVGPNDLGDCPNLDYHMIIAGVDHTPRLMSKKEAAEYIGLDPRTLNKHMAAGRLPSQLIGMTAVFIEADVMLFKQVYWH